MGEPAPLTPAERRLLDSAARPKRSAGRLLVGLGVAMLVGTALLSVLLTGQLAATFETDAEANAYAYGLLLGRITFGLAAAGAAFGLFTLFAGSLLLAGPIAERDRLIVKLAEREHA